MTTKYYKSIMYPKRLASVGLLFSTEFEKTTGLFRSRMQSFSMNVQSPTGGYLRPSKNTTPTRRRTDHD